MSSGDSEFTALLREIAHVSEVPLSAELGSKNGGDAKPSPEFQLTPTIRLVRPLGSGGMGTVWLARHEGLDLDVAVKLISRDRAGSERRFAREAQMAAGIRSPHVVEVFDFGTTVEGRPYLVMELLAGETLEARLARETTLPLATVASLVSQVAEALEAAHAQGVVHRDIKPSNLFLVASDEGVFVKILDFGVAVRTSVSGVSRMTETGALLGTPGYMSPEQLMDAKEADARADAYSLGVVAYEALTGRLPFVAKTVAALGHRLATGAFDPPSGLVAGAGPDLDAWFVRALGRRPEDRFASAAEMAAAFDACVDGGADARLGERRGAIGRRRAQLARSLLFAPLVVVAVVSAQRWLAAQDRAELPPAKASFTETRLGMPPHEGPATGDLEGPRPGALTSATTASESDVPAPHAPRPIARALATASSPPIASERAPSVEVEAVPADTAPDSSLPAYCNDPEAAFTLDDEGFVTLKQACRERLAEP